LFVSSFSDIHRAVSGRFSSIFSARLLKQPSTCAKDQFDEKITVLKEVYFFHHLWILIENFYASRRNILPWICQKCILKAHTISLRKMIRKKTIFSTFSYIEQEKIGLLLKVSQKLQLSKRHLTRAEEHVERKIMFRVNFISIFSGHWVNIFAFLAKKISFGMSKLHSNYPYDHFQEKKISEKKIYTFLDIEVKKLGHLS